jgi:hypothetical protein
MVKYIAKEVIGDYKVGDEVPEEKALVWKEMYAESPVEEELPVKEVLKKEIKKEVKVEVIKKKQILRRKTSKKK